MTRETKEAARDLFEMGFTFASPAIAKDLLQNVPRTRVAAVLRSLDLWKVAWATSEQETER
jgi:hypothetical protein